MKPQSGHLSLRGVIGHAPLMNEIGLTSRWTHCRRVESISRSLKVANMDQMEAGCDRSCVAFAVGDKMGN